jgi:hypothetical protein
VARARSSSKIGSSHALDITFLLRERRGKLQKWKCGGTGAAGNESRSAESGNKYNTGIPRRIFLEVAISDLQPTYSQSVNTAQYDAGRCGAISI